MRLPRDNSVALPEGNALLVDSDDLVALSDAEVLALLPAWVRRAASPLRDAVVRASRLFWQEVQQRVGRVLGAMQTPRNAEGLRLVAHGDRRHIPPFAHEAEHEYRARLLLRPAKITPNAVRAAVAALVLADTPVAPICFEPATEGVFVQSEATQDAWCAFVQAAERPPLWAVYPGNLIPAGAWVGPEADVTRPVFVVLIEGALYDLPDQPFALPEGATAPEVDAQFVGKGSTPLSWGFASSEVPPLVERLVREVEARRGAGVVWWLSVLPDLRGAM